MKKSEARQIFRLLEAYWPRAKQLTNAGTLTAWWRVLEKLPYEDVRASVEAYAATHKYFPDVADVTAAIYPQEAAAPRRKPLRAHIEKLRELSPEPCPILAAHEGDGGPVGAIMRAHCPEECGGCARAEDCYWRDKLRKEREQ